METTMLEDQGNYVTVIEAIAEGLKNQGWRTIQIALNEKEAFPRVALVLYTDGNVYRIARYEGGMCDSHGAPVSWGSCKDLGMFASHLKATIAFHRKRYDHKCPYLLTNGSGLPLYGDELFLEMQPLTIRKKTLDGKIGGVKDYIAFLNKAQGVYLDHQSETAGKIREVVKNGLGMVRIGLKTQKFWGETKCDTVSVYRRFCIVIRDERDIINGKHNGDVMTLRVTEAGMLVYVWQHADYYESCDLTEGDGERWWGVALDADGDPRNYGPVSDNLVINHAEEILHELFKLLTASYWAVQVKDRELSKLFK